MNVVQERSYSLWMDTKVADASPLVGEITTDVAVIGAGIAGLSTAYELVARGRSAVVIDRGTIGGGMTARTTAHLASALDDGYAALEAARGGDVARIVYQSQATAINRIEMIQANENIACDFQRVDGYLMLAPGSSGSELDKERDACRRIRIPVFDVAHSLALQGKELGRALRFPDQARFHPLKYLAGLAQAFKRQGGRLFADTVVESALEEKAGVTIKTERGTVYAQDVVFATNSPIGGSVTLHIKQAPYRTYAIAAPLRRGSLTDALFWDTADPYHYVRLQPYTDQDDIVIVGGEDHKSGRADDAEVRFAGLERWARDRIPNIGAISHRWSGQVMEPADCIGFVGRNDGDKHRYVVTGDSGQGMTNGVLASLLISSLIVDGQSPWTAVYDPGRFITRSIATLVTENMTVLKNFAEYLTAGEIASIEQLRPGQGGLFRSGLKKIAACRDVDGRLHLHSATCTHMGCVVHWNSLEQCWDCPCHGSQFAPDGAPLNGPAVMPLADAGIPPRRLEAAE
jgi:glycine/D-amino acid oxidase-like deaminating enzyme/nitrite reductase/ring-hydroxylating ferredoxin subunit